jgi:hypothetical protein
MQPNPPAQFRTLILEPEPDFRHRLRSFVAQHPHAGPISLCDQPQKAIIELSLIRDYSLVLVSARLGLTQALKFAPRALELAGPEPTTYVLVLASSDYDARIEARAQLSGYSCVLTEPYSLSSFESMLLAMRKSKLAVELSAHGKKLASFAEEVMGLVDVLVILKRNNSPPQRSKQMLEEARLVLQKLSPEALETFFLACEETLRDRPAVDPVWSDLIYSGRSKRVRQSIEKELLSRLRSRLKGRGRR